MAQYMSINELVNFDFHDANVSSVSFQGSDMIWTLEAANVKTTNSQSSFSCDMCAGTMQLTFKDYSVEKFMSYGGYSKDTNCNIIEQYPDIDFHPSKYKTMLESLVYLYHYFMETETVLTHNFEATTGPDVLLISIVCTKVIAEWDTYNGEAWYVRDAERIAARKKYVAGSSDPI